MLGIDFGTSTTIAALYANGKASIVKTSVGDEITPSFVAFMPDGKVQVGRNARGRRLIDSANTLFSVKRILGRNASSSEMRAFQKQYPFAMETGNDNIPRFVTRAGKLTAIEVTSYLLAHLREAPSLAGHMFPQITMTVPVSFKREQRTALTTAAMHAGFRGVELVEEPCAAALACLRGDPREQLVAVYDLGGGTFDVTIVQSSTAGMKVLATGGDSYLGGDDITARCANWVVEQVLKEYRWNIRSSEVSYQKLLFMCDNVKMSLSFSDQQEINLTGIDEVLKDKTVILRRDHLEKISMDLIQRTFLICDETLRNAGVSANRVNAVVLSGGCCYMPFVRSSIKSYFGQEPKMQLPPDKVVALGAALNAGESTLTARSARP